MHMTRRPATGYPDEGGINSCSLQMIFTAVRWLGRLLGRMTRALSQCWPSPPVSPDVPSPSLPAIEPGEASSSRPLTPQEMAVLRGMKRERQPDEEDYPGSKRPCRLLVDHLVEERERLRVSLLRVSGNLCSHVIFLTSALQTLDPYEGLDLSDERLEDPSDTV